jgi:hypothetical protein
MSSYQEQLAKCKSSTEEYNTIWKNKEWTIKDYEDLFADIERGYIIQGDFDTHHNYFIINPAFEEEPISKEQETINMWEQTFIDEERIEKECASCNNILTWEDGEYTGEGHRCSGCYFKEEGEN